MESEYIDGLSQEDQVAQVCRTLIRLYITSQVQARSERKWSLPQLAIEFEIEQAARLAAEPHTVSSLSATLGLSIKAVSRIVRDLIKWGTIEQHESPTDARVKYLCPTAEYYNNGGDVILTGIQAVLQHAFGDSWRELEPAQDLDWFPDASLYSGATPDIAGFRRHFKFEED